MRNLDHSFGCEGPNGADSLISNKYRPRIKIAIGHEITLTGQNRINQSGVTDIGGLLIDWSAGILIQRGLPLSSTY